MPPDLEDGFLTTGPIGKSPQTVFKWGETHSDEAGCIRHTLMKQGSGCRWRMDFRGLHRLDCGNGEEEGKEVCETGLEGMSGAADLHIADEGEKGNTRHRLFLGV